MQKVRKGDRVKVIAGNDRGKVGKVLVVYPDQQRIIVENVHMVTKHQRATEKLREPGIIQREGTIHVSDVLPICPGCGLPTRIKFTVVEGEKMRQCTHCGETFR